MYFLIHTSGTIIGPFHSSDAAFDWRDAVNLHVEHWLIKSTILPREAKLSQLRYL